MSVTIAGKDRARDLSEKIVETEIPEENPTDSKKEVGTVSFSMEIHDLFGIPTCYKKPLTIKFYNMKNSFHFLTLFWKINSRPGDSWNVCVHLHDPEAG